jgi:hypothetical protein
VGDEWLCLEAFLCIQAAVPATRFMMQTRFNKRNSGCCDSLGKCPHVCITCNFCVARICCDCSAESEALCKGGNPGCIDCCAHCQVDAELAHIKKGEDKGPPVGLLQELPNHFITARVLVPKPGAVAQAPNQQILMTNFNPDSVITISQV